MSHDLNMVEKIVVGIDLGSLTAKAVLLDQDRNILESVYKRHLGHPGKVLYDILHQMFERFPMDKVTAVGVTGSGGKRITTAVDGVFINEVIAESLAVSSLHRGVRSVINIGGQDSKLISIETRDEGDGFIVNNFAMNTLCAAGTGAFLDQQATRLGVDIETEFGELALLSGSPPRIAGRCSVFAKSDMIHLQQKGAAIHDIISGLCFAVARNFKATIGKNMEIAREVAFIGGVARNKGMVRAFEEVLGLQPGELIIPEQNTVIGAIGAALNVIDRAGSFVGLAPLQEYLSQAVAEEEGFPPLGIREAHLVAIPGKIDFPPRKKPAKVFLGIDVGSISTNLVLVDEARKIVAKEYLRTGSRPIDAVKRGLREISRTIGPEVEIVRAGTTGSARYLIGDFIGADVVKDEITAHARGAREIDPEVDTIFEIGGQDSKYISLDNGSIIDFEMNKVCAAGTGSFLEEQAERLSISIENEFSDFAISAQDPARCGERCTVFMESDLIHHQQKGKPKRDIVAGLAYSIVYNYLNKVVEGRRIGRNIFFQGGVAFNKAVTAAFERVMGKEVTVPPHHEVMGAYGAALLALDARGEKPSSFRGFDASELEYELNSFECERCSNHCRINQVIIDREATFYYGSRCDIYDTRGENTVKRKVPDYYGLRDRLLRGIYPHSIEPGKGLARIGIPFSMTIYEDFPFWKAFFTELGCEIELSSPTSAAHIDRGLETVVEETCFPIKVLHGHLLELIDRKVDYIFLPYMMDMWSDNARLKETLLCTYVQQAPGMVRTAIDFNRHGIKILSPIVKPSAGRRFLTAELTAGIGAELAIGKSRVSRAVDVGQKYLSLFRSRLVEEGKKALASIEEEDDFAIVTISRPYNGPDRGINLDIPGKFNSLGIKVIPMDFLPLAEEDIQEEIPNMYWWFGHRVLAAARIIRNNPRLYPVYINNFACGPDSFLLQYFLYMMGGKPSLVLEIDEHSADGGIMTRAEAFIDSLKAAGTKRTHARESRDFPVCKPAAEVGRNILKAGKTLYLPYIADHNYALAAAMQAYGIDARVMPPSDNESMRLGRQYTNNKECLPYIVITGDIVRQTRKKEFDSANSAFFMPSANGVCRLNHYESMQRLVLERLGLQEVDIYAPVAEKAVIDMGRVNRSLPLHSWTAVVAADVLFQALLQTRPYETKEGTANKVYFDAREVLYNTLREKGNVINAMRIARGMFDAIKVDRTRIRPRIGIIGEFYLRWHPGSNSRIIELIEELGGEVLIPAIAENMLHFNHVVLNEAGRKNRHMEWLTTYLSDRWQIFQERRVYEPFSDFLEVYPVPGVQELEELAQPYVDEIIENEISISTGKARWLLEEKHAQGIMNLIPFTCLLGTPIAAYMKSLKEDYPDAAITTFKFDGAEDVNIRTRLEAFMHQASYYSNARNTGSNSRAYDDTGKKISYQDQVQVPGKERSGCPGPDQNG